MERRSRSPRAHLFFLATGAALLGLIPSPAAAQSPWMARDGNQTLMLEFLGPAIEGTDQELFSGAFFLGGRGAVGSRIFVVGELPFVRHESTDEFSSSEISSSTIGNPYVGLEMNLASGPAFIELGVRPPLAADDEFPAVTTGIISDVTRWEAFFPEVFSIVGAFNVREVTPSKLAYRLRVGPAVMVPTNDGSEETTVFAVYSFQVGYHGPMARVGAGMSGRSQLSDLGGTNVGAASFSQFEIHADFLSGQIRPGLDLKMPLGELAEGVPKVLGVSVTWTR